MSVLRLLEFRYYNRSIFRTIAIVVLILKDLVNPFPIKDLIVPHSDQVVPVNHCYIASLWWCRHRTWAFILLDPAVNSDSGT